METLLYTVPGMSCDHCKTAVHEEISTVAGVADMSVGPETKRVEVTGDDLDDAAIKAAIEDAGYEARIASDPTMTSPSVNRAE
ncbi:MAG TPA: heavy-metal-associated domain-containing protein [Gaiellaceae bacterium]|nr:heavy-metal-associated domain-containing protein [Gaiellaceae bacterium]